jgi:hypothetical protein
MRIINILDFEKFTDYYSEKWQFNTWDECLRDTGIKQIAWIDDTFQIEITDAEYTWFVLRWA